MKDTEWKWPNEAQWKRDTCTGRSWNYRWRTSYHWWLKTLITEEYLPFKKVDQRKLRDITKKVNALIWHIETDDVTQINKLAMAAVLWVAKEVGVKKEKRGDKIESWWKRRVESDITNLRRDIKRLERDRRGETEWKAKRKFKEVNAKYRVKKVNKSG